MYFFYMAGQGSRIALRTLQLPTSKQGLAFPNLYLYYLATQLVTLCDWLHKATPAQFRRRKLPPHLSPRNMVYQGRTNA